MITLAVLCLAGALSLALVTMIVAWAFGWRDRGFVLSAASWLLAIWILLTVGLGVALAGGPLLLDKVVVTLLGGWLAASLFLHLIDRRLRRISHPARLWGAHGAHLGVAIAILGMLLSVVFGSEVRRTLEPGDTTKFNAWTVQLHEVWPAAGDGWVGVKAELRASEGDGIFLLKPQLRAAGGGSPTLEPATIDSGTGVLEASIGPRLPDGKWPVVLRSTPLLTMIPLGALIAAVGGTLAMIGPPIGRRRRRRQRRLATAWWA